MCPSVETCCNLSPTYFSRGSKHGPQRQTGLDSNLDFASYEEGRGINTLTPPSSLPPSRPSAAESRGTCGRPPTPAGSPPVQTGQRPGEGVWRMSTWGPAVSSRMEMLLVSSVAFMFDGGNYVGLS